jgi:rhodanese-related sulfurtransferase
MVCVLLFLLFLHATHVTSDDDCAGKVLVLDVRNASEWNAGHVGCAVNLPLEIMPTTDWVPRLKTLTEGRTEMPIITYCRTGHRADVAAELLSAEGYTAVRDGGGYNCTGNVEWDLDNCLFPVINQRRTLESICKACRSKTGQLKNILDQFKPVTILYVDGEITRSAGPMVLAVGVALASAIVATFGVVHVVWQSRKKKRGIQAPLCVASPTPTAATVDKECQASVPAANRIYHSI